MTRRRWIADSSTTHTASLYGEQAHHLARVLRAEVGMHFDVVAAGQVWRAAISSIEGDAVHLELLQPLAAEEALPITLLLSVFKFDRMEWAVEKATELGVASIIPVITRRTEKHLAQASAKRAERWRRIALEAAKQSRRTDIPEIKDPVSLRDATHQLATNEPGSLNLLLAEAEAETSLLAALQNPRMNQAISLAIGPEGGWTPDELSFFAAQGWRSVTLGTRILRAETATIAALAVCGSALSETAKTATQEKKEPRS